MSLKDLLKTKDDELTIDQLLDKAVIAQANSETRERHEIEVHPSEVGHVCSRYIQYNAVAHIVGIRAVATDAHGLRIFQTGHAEHRQVYQELKEAGILLKTEFRLVDDAHGITGTADAKIMLEGKKVLLDVKTINSRGWRELVKGPKQAHVDQLQLYMHIDGTTRAVLVYSNKDSQERKYLFFRRDQEKIDFLLQKIRTVHRAIHEKRLLPRIADTPKSYPCAYCPWKQTCFSNTKVPWPATTWDGKRTKLIPRKGTKSCKS